MSAATDSGRPVMILAGGTGGHIFPAWPWPACCAGVACR